MSTLTRSRSKDGATASVARRPVGTRHDESKESSGTKERTLSSDHLLQGQSHVFIAHNGERYQLRATRLGKLILTK